MSRLYEALTAIGRKAHVQARTDLPHSLAEGPTRHRWSAIALGAVAVLGAAWLTVMPDSPVGQVRFSPGRIRKMPGTPGTGPPISGQGASLLQALYLESQ